MRGSTGLIGDQQPDATTKYTFADVKPYKANSPLLPSGLLGPVKLEKETAQRMNLLDRRQFLGSAGIVALAVALPKYGLSLPFAAPGGSSFPPGFFWGASTAAAQSEGSPLADGGGESIWDVFLRTPKATADGSNNLVADDEYHRWPEDLKLMQQIGLNAYRFSVSWPRVLPEGKGRVNAKGLDYYDRLIDALLVAKITPFLTTYHFDYPEALQKQGGWLNPDSSQWLADYCHLLSSRLSDRVSHWLTINEPNILWAFGSEAGTMPPQQKLGDAELVLGAHNILLGHGKSVQSIRAAAKRPVEVSLAFAGMFSLPASNSPADIAAARTASFRVTEDQARARSVANDNAQHGLVARSGLSGNVSGGRSQALSGGLQVGKAGGHEDDQSAIGLLRRKSLFCADGQSGSGRAAGSRS